MAAQQTLSAHAGGEGPVGWKRHVPNALTLLRVAMAVAMFAVLEGWSYEEAVRGLTGGSGQTGGGGEEGGGYEGWFVPQGWMLLVAAGLFVMAALTDAADGYLARKWRVVSVFGRVMDPFADKLLVLGAVVYLAGPGFSVRWWDAGGLEHSFQASGVGVWMAVVVMGRELLVTSLRGAFESRGVDFSATAIGKWKMILQSVAVPMVLVILAWGLGKGNPGGEGPTYPAGYSVIVALVWAMVVVTAWSGLVYVGRAVTAGGGPHKGTG